VRVRRHNDRNVLPGPALLNGESPALDERHGQHVEVVRAHDDRERPSRLEPLADADDRGIVGEHAAEHVRARGQLLIDRIRERAIVTGSPVACVELNQTVRFREGAAREGQRRTTLNIAR
jgi:hypothetical protein